MIAGFRGAAVIVLVNDGTHDWSGAGEVRLVQIDPAIDQLGETIEIPLLATTVVRQGESYAFNFAIGPFADPGQSEVAMQLSSSHGPFGPIVRMPVQILAVEVPPCGADGAGCPTVNLADFGGDANAALYWHANGLRGQPGTVYVPPGLWVQDRPILMQFGQRLIGAGPSSVIRKGPCDEVSWQCEYPLVTNNVNWEWNPNRPYDVEGTDPEDPDGTLHHYITNANHVEVAHLRLETNKIPATGGFERALMFNGLSDSHRKRRNGVGDDGPSYYVDYLKIHDLDVVSRSGLLLSIARYADVRSNRFTGAWGMANRCQLSQQYANQADAAAGIALGRMVHNSTFALNIVQNFPAEGLYQEPFNHPNAKLPAVPSDDQQARTISEASSLNVFRSNFVRDNVRVAMQVTGPYNVLESNFIHHNNILSSSFPATWSSLYGHNEWKTNQIREFGSLIFATPFFNGGPGNVIPSDWLTNAAHAVRNRYVNNLLVYYGSLHAKKCPGPSALADNGPIYLATPETYLEANYTVSAALGDSLPRAGVIELFAQHEQKNNYFDSWFAGAGELWLLTQGAVGTLVEENGVAPLSTSDCAWFGGTWSNGGCDFVALDAGLLCTTPDDCEGTCLADFVSDGSRHYPHFDGRVGECSSSRQPEGCFEVVRDGVQQQECY